MILERLLTVPLYFILGMTCTVFFAKCDDFETFTEWIVSIITWPFWATGKIIRAIYLDVAKAILIYVYKWRNR
jgi:hypothetical protein